MLLLLSLCPALAAIPVVFDGGEPSAAVEAVAARTGLPADQLEAIALDTLLAHGPATLGEVVVRRCAREDRRMAEVRAELSRAEAALSADNPVECADHLDLAVSQLTCLVEVVERPIAARVFLLRGALAAEAQQTEEATEELRSALALQPDLSWRAGYPTAGTSLLAAVIEDTTRHHLHRMPSYVPAGPWIDGQALPQEGIDLSPGLHLAQYSEGVGVKSAWLVVGGEGTLVLPSAYRKPLLLGLQEPARRPQVEALLGATLPNLEAAYIVHGGGMWLLTQEEGVLDTTELQAPPPPAPPEPEVEGKAKKKRGKRR